MKLLNLILLFFVVQAASAQIKVAHLQAKDVPKNMPYKGEIKEAIQYTDKEGTHTVITTEDETIKKVDGDDQRLDELYAYCYLQKGSSVTLLWKLYDFAGPCDVDVEAAYTDKAYVTDLDNNGVAEVWLTYLEACKGDVSPSDMKIIMHEGAKKFAMRGTTRVKINATDHMGGEYKFDEVFKAAPQSFRDYAAKLWKKNMNEDHFY
jgi:hypothetical protein